MSNAVETLPILALRDLVMFPRMISNLLVGREASISALENSRKSHNSRIILVAQKDTNKDNIKGSDLYKVGVVSKILQVLRLQNANARVLVEGFEKVHISNIKMNEEGFLQGNIKIIAEEVSNNQNELFVLRRSIQEQFEEYIRINKRMSQEVLTNIMQIEDTIDFCNTICSHIIVPLEKKQQLLEINNSNEKLEKLLVIISSEIDFLRTEDKIKNRVRTQIEKNQKDYYLNEQLKAIHKELGEDEDENDVLQKKIEKLKLSKEAKEKALSELKKLRMMNSMSSEANVIRNYLDWLLSLPWDEFTPTNSNLKKAQAQLDNDHYGLEKVKERIIEYLAVMARSNKSGGPIICLVGPPGVGKTSLARSIAETTGRKFIKIALGGLRDEAAIRGHRRTYIGSLPGEIIQAMKKAGTSNPLILLDEIDKMSSDFRGDPSSALLEILDPEQNKRFSDHYLEVDYDLSNVMFIATANSLNLQRPLLDRLEIINISGYTHDEKEGIAMNYLVEKQRKLNGLAEDEIEVDRSAIRDIIRYYTREAGVRNLERAIAKVMRKVVTEILLAQQENLNETVEAINSDANIDVNGEQSNKKSKKAKNVKIKAENTQKVQEDEKKAIKVVVDSTNLGHFLGVRKYDYSEIEKKNLIGIVNGLAYTEVGGDLLAIESVFMPGKGEVKITGKLGDVMKESAQAAISYIRSRAADFGIMHDIFKDNDIHIHVPEGAVPKDGPSAGVTICTSIISALTGNPARRDVAMTGEITLRGNVLPIGGLKEKLLAALRGGVKRVIIPKENAKDLEEIPQNVKTALEIIPVEHMDDLLKLVLADPLKPIVWTQSTLSEKDKIIPNNGTKSNETGNAN